MISRNSPVTFENDRLLLKVHKIIFLLTRSYLFRVFAGFQSTTNLASYEALPVSLLVCILLCSSPPFPMLAQRRCASVFFKVLNFQYLTVRNGYLRSLTCSVCVAEVTRVNIISVSPIPTKSGALHEVSGVKVPRPASPCITHETPSVTRRDGGCCISWHVYG